MKKLIKIFLLLIAINGYSQDSIVIYGNVQMLLGEDTYVYNIPDTICNGTLYYYSIMDSTLVITGYYENCNKEGFWIEYWSNGNKREIIKYSKGVFVQQINFYRSGEKNFGGGLINENLEMVGLYYYKSGTIRQKVYMSDIGEILKVEHFNDKGELIRIDKYLEPELF